MYRLEYKKSVAKELKAIPKSQLTRIVKRIQALAINPRPIGYVKLQGDSGVYRIRQGDYRIIYNVRDEIVEVMIIKVGHRKDIYE